MKENIRSTINYLPYSARDYRDTINSFDPQFKAATNIISKEYNYCVGKESCTFKYFIPQNRNDALVLYIPGTAFINTAAKFNDVICSHLAKETESLVILLNHRLAPEHKFPAAREDVIRFVGSMSYLVHALGVDINKITLIGYSSGGNLISSASMSLDNIFALHILVSPMLDLSRSISGCTKYDYKETHVSRKLIKWFCKQYLQNNISPKHPHVSPIFQTNHHLRKLPPTLTISGENDCFRGDSEIYCKKINNAGGTGLNLVVKNIDHSVGWFELSHVKNAGSFIRKNFSLNSINSLSQGFFGRRVQKNKYIKRYHLSESVVKYLEMRP